jgi:phosphoglucomutase
MAGADFEIASLLEKATEAGDLRKSSAENIRALLGASPSRVYAAAIAELARAGEWAELNDRFYKTLAFGTGGLRGRTIGKIVTRAERGDAASNERPQFPCVGTNSMNYFNVNRATQGLVAYLHDWRTREKIEGRPKIVIAYDSRHFSKEFADLAARTAVENGCDACVFAGPRSTPELSFAVRQLRASAGIVITASHNPPHDNGYKVYFNDGAQVVEPHAGEIIARVSAVKSETSTAQPEKRGEVSMQGREIDEAYMERLESLILNRELVRSGKSLRVIFTSLHGTGGVIIKPMLERLGLNFQVVEEQDRFDGDFPTVASPNPENAAALQLGVELAEKEGADLVIATDPDCDRMGVAVRTAGGTMELITGNQIGSLLAYYRAKTLFAMGVLTPENASRAVIIKTFVTTDLQKAIAEHYGVRCVETLTGFKYIGAKLGKYERELLAALGDAGLAGARPSNGEEVKVPREDDPVTLARTRPPYQEMSEEETRALRLTYSSYCFFAGEESYGYTGGDFARDKDGNGAAIMFCEVAAHAKACGLTVDALLDEIFSQFGYFQEYTGALTFEGAEGAETIKRLLASYVTRPPLEMLGAQLIQVKNFEADTYRDVEGDEIPKETMLLFEFGDHTRVAVRASGTEPKIKYYLFAQRRPEGTAQFTSAELAEKKREVGEHLKRVWEWLRQDASVRSGA